MNVEPLDALYGAFWGLVHDAEDAIDDVSALANDAIDAALGFVVGLFGRRIVPHTKRAIL